MVISDGFHLQKILLDPLSGAMKHTQAGSTVGMQITETDVDADAIRLYFAVEDNGISIAPEFLECIFMPFKRAGDGRINRATGTGLGLAITRDTANTMEGDIYVENEKNIGSQFTVELPLKLPKLQIQELSSLTGYPVLIVDGDQDACENISLILQEAGIRTS